MRWSRRQVRRFSPSFAPFGVRDRKDPTLFRDLRLAGAGGLGRALATRIIPVFTPVASSYLCFFGCLSVHNHTWPLPIYLINKIGSTYSACTQYRQSSRIIVHQRVSYAVKNDRRAQTEWSCCIWIYNLTSTAQHSPTCLSLTADVQIMRPPCMSPPHHTSTST
jgi:hypothetical protein